VAKKFSEPRNKMSAERRARVEARVQAALKEMPLYTRSGTNLEAMGGELEIVVRFPDGAVKISQFAELEAPEAK